MNWVQVKISQHVHCMYYNISLSYQVNLDCKLSDRALANITELARMRLLYASCLVLVCFDLSTSCWIVSYSEVVLIVLIMKITRAKLGFPKLDDSKAI